MRTELEVISSGANFFFFFSSVLYQEEREKEGRRAGKPDRSVHSPSDYTGGTV